MPSVRSKSLSAYFVRKRERIQRALLSRQLVGAPVVIEYVRNSVDTPSKYVLAKYVAEHPEVSDSAAQQLIASHVHLIHQS